MESRTLLPRAACLLLCLLVTACASTPRNAGEPNDPLEPVNRKIYTFNDFVDRYALKPAAEGYETVTPSPVNQAISNFFSNLGDVVVLVNSALQLKPHATGITAQRLLLNSTFGIFGLMDVATGADKPKQHEDFGQTLGYWGLAPGPYLVLPILGPNDLRDTAGLVADYQYAPIPQTQEGNTEIGLQVLRGIDTRAGLLGAGNLRDTAAVDPYTYTRNAYLRRRANRVRDGRPAREKENDNDGFDPFSSDDDDLFESGSEDTDSSDN